MNDPTLPSPKSRYSLPKVAAVCCSVALVGAYVAYRSGATLLPGTKSGPVVSNAEPSTAPTTAPLKLSEEFVVMSSSKSGPVVQPTTARARRTLPGSKSMRVLEREDANVLYGEQSATQPASTSPSLELTLQPDGSGAVQPLPKPERRVMPGSKAAVVFEQPDASRLLTTRPATQPTTRPDFRLGD